MIRFTINLCLFLFVASTVSFEEHTQIVSLREINGRIINGQNATAGQFPWQAFLLILSDSTVSLCGGSIIGEEWILTAAHCIESVTSVTVGVGSTNLSGSALQIQASELILHEEYVAETLANDIALVRLPVKLSFDELIAPVALSSEPLEAGEEITVSGFGVTADDSSALGSMFLKYVTVTTITNSECAERYGDLVVEDMVCTGVGDPIQGTCYGDSGSPGVLNADTDPLLVAIASFVSTNGCEAGFPYGFTRVAYYRDWIKEKSDV